MRVAIYARVSTDAQERDGTSLDSQVKACEQFAAARSWSTVACVRDAASGSVLERAGLEEVRRLVRRQEVDVVLAYAVDRLSRNQNHIGVLFDETSSHGVRLEFATESFEDTAVGRFILAARAFVAEIEREKIRERTMRGKAERAKSGRMPQGTGKGLYGYRYEPESGRREPHEFQAAVVRRIFEDFAAGASIIGLANSLNDQGIPTFTGKLWYPATVFHLLENPAYMGRTVYRRTQVMTRKDPQTGRRRRHVTTRDPGEWIEVIGATEAIIPEELFERVQARLRDPERLKRGRRTATYALAGRVRCAVCGCSMVGQTLQGSYRYYRCRRAFSGPKHDRCSSKYVIADYLESAVLEAVDQVLAHPEVVVAEIQRTRTTEIEPQPDHTSLNATLEAQRQRTLHLYQIGEIDDARLEEELARIRRERDRLAKQAKPKPPANAEFDFEDILRGVQEWLAQADKSELPTVAEALQLAVSAETGEAEIAGAVPSFTHHWTNIGNCFSRRATRVERGQRALDDRASIVRVNVHAKRFEDRRAHLGLGAGKAVEDVPARCLQTDHVYADRLRGSRVASAFPLQRRDLGPDSAELLADDSLINLSKRKEMDQPPLAVLELH